MLTGIGGGMLRDVLVREIPVVLRADFYALAALAGASVVVVGKLLHVSPVVAAIVGGVLEGRGLDETATEQAHHAVPAPCGTSSAFISLRVPMRCRFDLGVGSEGAVQSARAEVARGPKE
jgi:glycine transporter